MSIITLYSGKVWLNLANRRWFAKLKPSKLLLAINNLLADLLIHQTFFCQILENSQFAKFSHYTVSNNYSLQSYQVVLSLARPALFTQNCCVILVDFLDFRSPVLASHLNSMSYITDLKVFRIIISQCFFIGHVAYLPFLKCRKITNHSIYYNVASQ